MTGHTPGDWAYNRYTGEVYLDDGDVCPRIARVDLDNTEPEQALADGLLIAAAPVLLAALQEIHAAYNTEGWADRTYAVGQSIGRVRAVIAKAKGETA